ncbi:unnamed protein product [Meloidogyne enterolobii]|uniref:Uncharacterized protein n=1 Tax=Meloidogyne enterolobii TaxID=390850 RepID=A0ACB0ZC93_MELEN
MEDESDLEDLEDEDDGEFLGLEDSEDGEDDSLMDEEDDSSIFDEEEDEKSDPDTSRELVDLNITGYNISTNTSNCIVLNAQKDYSTAANPFKLFKFSADTEHSVQVGLKVLQWILSPIVTDTFFNDILQKRVLVLKRATNAYFDGFFNIGDFKDMLKNNNVLYGKDVNVASYVSGVRQTHNPLKKEMQRATITNALQHFQNGRSLQCVHPQVFNDKICYLTPAGTAGFAPHYDNIDAFILQTEGRKHWKIYAPESLDDTLPLESSDNLNESDFMEREPVFDGWLDQGDVLYVPRGFAHQANTGQDKLSHHVTISICRKFSYAHFFEQASSEFILLMTEKSKRLRGALPPHFFDMCGMADIAYPNEDSLNNKLIYEDEGTACIVHRMNNSRRYDENKEELTFDFSTELEKGYITLCNSYPKWKTVQSLGCASLEKNIELATLLFNNCVLMLRQKEKK